MDHNFCQKCGFERIVIPPGCPPKFVHVDEGKIKARLTSLSSYKSKKPYERQKCSLQKQLESFLWSLPTKKSIAIASPADIINFLVWRDSFGKTVCHSDNCPAAVNKAINCNCPVVLSAGTIDNNIGKLRSIFRENGRGMYWSEDLHIGNPAAHSSVRDYYKIVLEEQTQARATPSQAVPIFLDKIVGLCSYLRDSLKNPELKPVTLYILARDLAFFSIDFFSGDRGSDLGRIKCSDTLIFPDQDGFLFNQVFGKTLRGNKRNTFAVKRIPGSPVCPVSNLNCYLSICKAINIDLRQGYLFRATDQHGCISASPFIGSAIANRLKKHLKALSIHEGETVHSFRSGCSITLASLGVSYTEIANHVGWKSTDMAEYYSQYEKVSRCSDPSTVFSAATVSKIREKGEHFKRNNELIGFKPLFDLS